MAYCALELDGAILTRVLAIECKTDMAGKAFMAQVQSVPARAEVTTYLTVRSFTEEGFSEGATLPGVGLRFRHLKQQRLVFESSWCRSIPVHQGTQAAWPQETRSCQLP